MLTPVRSLLSWIITGPRGASVRGRTAAPRAVTLLVAMAVAAIAPMVITAPAAQASSYRYWSYWHQSNGDWTYASQGAGTFRPKDGNVEGWRYAVSSGASSSTRPPRAGDSFASLCSGVEATDGTRRVGLVVDYGTTADAPDGETPRAMGRYCVRVADGATGLAVLRAVTSYRSDSSGLICGIAGYPRSECATVVRSNPVPAAGSKPPATATSKAAAGSAAKTSAAPTTSAAGAERPATVRATGPTTTPRTSAPDASTRPAGTASPEPSIAVVDASASSAPGGNPLPTILALAALVGIGGAIVLARRRRS